MIPYKSCILKVIYLFDPGTGYDTVWKFGRANRWS